MVDYAGPGELVQPGWGLRVPCGPRDRIVQGFAAELARLAGDPAALEPMARAARARVQSHFLWARKAGQLREVYDWVLGAAAKPDPFPVGCQAGQGRPEDPAGGR